MTLPYIHSNEHETRQPKENSHYILSDIFLHNWDKVKSKYLNNASSNSSCQETDESCENFHEFPNSCKQLRDVNLPLSASPEKFNSRSHKPVQYLSL